jgi:hypothetical protein
MVFSAWPYSYRFKERWSPWVMKLSTGQTSAGPSALHLTSFDLHGPSMVHHAMKHMLWYAMIKIVVFRLPLHGLHGFHERSSNGFTPYNMLRLNDAKAGESSGESSTRIQFWVLTQTENNVHCHISSSLDDICESCIWATEYTFWPGTGCPCTSRFPGQRSCFLYSHKYAWWCHSATSEMPLRLKNWEECLILWVPITNDQDINKPIISNCFPQITKGMLNQHGFVWKGMIRRVTYPQNPIKKIIHGNFTVLNGKWWYTMKFWGTSFSIEPLIYPSRFTGL